jgi:signal transduction histidine kinase
VRHNKIFQTTSFRLVAVYLGVFTLSVVILGVVVYFNVGRQYETEFDERVTTETRALLNYARTHDADALAERIRFLTRQAGALDYRLEGPTGALVAGGLKSIRTKDGKYRDGWIEIATPEPGSKAASDVEWERALVSTLDNGDVLVVGQQLTAVNEARRAVLVAFAWGLAATLVLGAAGGLVISASFLRRLDGMSRAAEGIMAGNLRKRIPEINANDDLGRLAHTFNRMLERIERLIEANRHVSHDIAHDLRKPLARIVRRLEAARASNVGVREYQQAVDDAIADVYGVLETFNALLRIAQVETGARQAGFKMVDLSTIAREVAEAFLPAADDEGKTLKIETSVSLALAGDEELLKQMVANVIDNALRHTPKGTRIDVRSIQIAGVATLVIGDDGAGVPEAERQRIFERFYRLDEARTTPGDGLGLSLVVAVAELHGMKVVAEDNRPGLRIAIEAPTN